MHNSVGQDMLASELLVMAPMRHTGQQLNKVQKEFGIKIEWWCSMTVVAGKI